MYERGVVDSCYTNTFNNKSCTEKGADLNTFVRLKRGGRDTVKASLEKGEGRRVFSSIQVCLVSAWRADTKAWKC